MQSTIKYSGAYTYKKETSRVSPWKKFLKWAEGQEENRFGWTAFSITSHGCVFTIITALMVLFTGNHFIFWPFVIGAMVSCVVVNLAAMPTKITIPVFFFSLIVDFAIIIICLANGFNAAAF